MLKKLLVNTYKSCFMYFTKTTSNAPADSDNDNNSIFQNMIVSTEIRHVPEIKFLDVVIVEKLSWDAHVKKLASCTGSIRQIAVSIPKNVSISYHRKWVSSVQHC